MKTCIRRPILLVAAMFLLLLFLFPAVKTGEAQNLDVPFVPTPHEVVEAMLDVAGVGPGDYVIDLGSGDGRIVIAAAQRGAFGHGVDLNPVRVEEAAANAEEAGVTDKVIFLEGDLFEADISKATVVTMYLLNTVNRKLKPTLFEQLKPGTRIVSYSFNMGLWEPDEHILVDNRDVFYWIIPAELSGSWEWTGNGENYIMDIKQEFQEITIELRAGDNSLQIREPIVRGDRISFIAEDPGNKNRYAFSGRVDNNTITGTIQTRGEQRAKIENWDATLR